MNISLRSLNRCDYYVIIWCLYQMQGLLYPEGFIGQGLQALMLVWALFETKDYILPNKCRPPLLKSISVLLFMYCIYGISLLIFNPDKILKPHVYLQEYLNSFLPIFLFYKYIKEGYLTEERIKKYIWIFLIVVIWHYFKYEQETFIKLRKRGSSRNEITNNIGYEFLALLPMTFFFYKKPVFQYSLLCLILLFIVMAMKRGPILIGSICFVWALIVNIKTAGNRKQRYATIGLGVTMILTGFLYVSYQLATSDYMEQRLEETREGKSSGRDHLYSEAVEIIVDDNSVTHLLIGHGADSTVGFLGKRAHQDWLETAMNNGIVGLCVLIGFCSVFFLTVLKRNDYEPKQIHTAFAILYFIFILKTMFSMSLSTMPCFQSMLMAFCICCKEDHENYNS